MSAQILTSRTAQIVLLILLLAGSVGVLLLDPPFVENLRKYSFDSYNRLMPRQIADDVVIIGVNEDSVKHLGQLPWSRNIQGDMAAKLRAMGAKSVGFDIIFNPRDRAVIPDGAGGVLDTDAYFAERMAKAGNIVLGMEVSDHEAETHTPIMAPPIEYIGGKDLGAYLYTAQHFLRSLPGLTGAAASQGIANFVPEDDGILRRVPLLMTHVDAGDKPIGVYPAVSLETVRIALGVKEPYRVVGRMGHGIEKIVLGPYSIPTDEHGTALLYFGGHKAATYLSYWKLLDGQIDASKVKDKIAFIGIESAGIGDVRASPIDPYMQGVEMHAEMASQILHGQFLQRTGLMADFEAALTVAVGLGVIFLAQEINALLLAGLMVLFYGAAGGGALALYKYEGWQVDIMCPLVVTTVIFVIASILANLRTMIVSNEKSKFLALMSHEIRTPMTGILGIIEFLKDEGLTREERTDFINTISECSKTLLNTLNDILDISKLEEGKLEISNINCDLHGVLANCVNILDRMARNKGIAVAVEIDDGVPRQIFGDPHRLQQIILNFMNNAIKFTPKGSVTVHAAFKAGPPPFIRIEVRDTGIGISEKNMKKLFSSFSQADDSIARKFGGTGLGLSIAKDLLLLMGGKVGVNSKLGEGSTFWFEIPFLPPIQDDATGEEENTDIGPLEVLLAEDNKVNQQVAMRLLGNKGHKVSIADDGETVVRMAQEKGFDMILMDMNMPIKSGIDAAKEIRALGGKYKEMPIIALTANVVDEYVKKCYAAGMNAHVAKPFSPKELYQVMAKFAPAHALAARPAPAAAAAAPESAGEKLNDNLQEIRKQLGAEYLNELIKNSLKEANRLLKAARDAYGAEDVTGLQHATHDLKNVSGLISLDETNHLAEVVETLCRKNELTALPDMVKALVRDAEREIRKMERARGLAS